MQIPALLPVRMLNELAWCPRLFALEWVHQEFAHSADTVQGQNVHARVDQPSRPLEPDPQRPVVARSVELSDEALGLIAKIDLVESEGGRVVPVDYKKGEAPDVPEGAWEPERVQVCAQALLLRAHGYTVEEGALWFAASRRRVKVPITEALVARTLALRDQARAVAAAERLPPPLVDSPKCVRCSLVGICMPDEQNQLVGETAQARPTFPARHDGVPLIVQANGAFLGKDADEIVVSERGVERGRVRIGETTRVVLLGNVTISSPLLRELAERDVPVAWHSGTGWFYGHFTPASGKNVVTRIAQHRLAADPAAALRLARAFVRSKILNSRVLLRRNGREVPDEALLRLGELADDVSRAPDTATLMGVEGAAARLYFQHFTKMLREGALAEGFSLEGRNRRPPRDPVNALLSFAYAALARECTLVLHGVGLDPYVGFLHQPRFGRPALALDLMEEFRPILADSAVLTVLNKAEVVRGDFVVGPTGVALTDSGRRSFARAIERRLDEEAIHPVFGTRLSYRRILEVQARLLGKVLNGELDAFPEYRVR